jgi:hypothetical protein
VLSQSSSTHYTIDWREIDCHSLYFAKPLFATMAKTSKTRMSSKDRAIATAVVPEVTLPIPHPLHVEAIAAAATRAVDHIQSFATDAATTDTGAMDPAVWETLRHDRTALLQAWEDYRAVSAPGNETVTSSDRAERHARVRESYVSQATEVFADDLARFHGLDDDNDNDDNDTNHNNNSNVDVDVLVECLQSGYDDMAEEEKEWYWEELQESEQSQLHGASTQLTPHEERRRYLGFDKVMDT